MLLRELKCKRRLGGKADIVVSIVDYYLAEMMNKVKVSMVLAIALTILSCKPDRDGGVVGPCVHIYEEPILHIESARNQQTGSYLQTIILSNILIDTAKADLQSLLFVSRRVAKLDSSLVGNPPFAFGAEPGRYAFRVSASGYRDTVVVCNPYYSINKGGCPSSSNGGLRINITLRPN